MFNPRAFLFVLFGAIAFWPTLGCDRRPTTDRGAMSKAGYASTTAVAAKKRVPERVQSKSTLSSGRRTDVPAQAKYDPAAPTPTESPANPEQANQERTASAPSAEKDRPPVHKKEAESTDIPRPKSSTKKARTYSRDELARLPLIQKDGLQYLGGFRVPGGKHGVSSFDYGGTAMAFNPSKGSLFMVGHDWQQAIGEVSIPVTFSKSKQPRDLPAANCLQPFVDVNSRIPKSTLKGTIKVGGLMVADGKLIGTLYVYYDADGSAKESHFQLDSLDVAKARVDGLFQVGTKGGGWVGGYMTEVPEEWRQAIGTRFLTGQAALPIISRTSFGPAAFGFDPTKLGASPALVTSYVFYTQAKPLGNLNGKDPNFNGTTEIKGLVFVPGTRSVLFFGSHGTGDVVYGEAADANDPHRKDKGYHSRNGAYEYQVWAYDANEFVAVRNGIKQPWQVKPYAVWHLSFPIDVGAKRVGGVAFDPQTNRIFLSQLHADEWGLPLIQAFEVKSR